MNRSAWEEPLKNFQKKTTYITPLWNLISVTPPENPLAKRISSISSLSSNTRSDSSGLEKIIKKINPKIVYTLSKNDINKDHKEVYESTLVVTRPQSSNVKQVFSYETIGMTISQFSPTVFEDISKEFKYKIKSFRMYKSELRPFPHPRSLKAIENLAIQRGIESGTKKAEAFELIRFINL